MSELVMTLKSCSFLFLLTSDLEVHFVDAYWVQKCDHVFFQGVQLVTEWSLLQT